MSITNIPKHFIFFAGINPEKIIKENNKASCADLYEINPHTHTHTHSGAKVNKLF